MLSKQTDKNWEVIGERMPYFGVITKNEFKPEALDQDAVNDFFATGEVHIEMVLAWIKRHLVENFQPTRCLDFGCGVGRLVIPLAKRFPQVVGVDISKGMLEEAKQNCTKLGLKNVTFVESDTALSKVNGKFDLIHSFIVLQHIEPQRGEKIFKRLLNLLNEDGIGVVHFTYTSNKDKFSKRTTKWLRENVSLVNGLINLVKGRDFDYPHIAMHQYDLNRILLMLQESDCDRVFLNFTEHGGALGVVLIFQKKTNSNPPNFQ